jgi:hypothetical protein
MKKSIFDSLGRYGLMVGLAFAASSCKKELPTAEADPNKTALVAVHNFALLMPSSAAVRINDAPVTLIGTPVALALGGSLGSNYVGVTPGSVKVAVRTTTGTADLASRTSSLAAVSATSYFAYDTLTAAGTVKMLALSNDTKPATAGTTNLRFLHLSPNAGTVSVSMTRTADATNTAASGTAGFSNVPYVGSTPSPNEASLSAYSIVPAGTYNIAVLSGTTPVLSLTGVVLREGKSYSLVARGFTTARPVIPSGQALAASLILHNP